MPRTHPHIKTLVVRLKRAGIENFLNDDDFLNVLEENDLDDKWGNPFADRNTTPQIDSLRLTLNDEYQDEFGKHRFYKLVRVILLEAIKRRMLNFKQLSDVEKSLVEINFPKNNYLTQIKNEIRDWGREKGKISTKKEKSLNSSVTEGKQQKSSKYSFLKKYWKYPASILALIFAGIPAYYSWINSELKMIYFDIDSRYFVYAEVSDTTTHHALRMYGGITNGGRESPLVLKRFWVQLLDNDQWTTLYLFEPDDKTIEIFQDNEGILTDFIIKEYPLNQAIHKNKVVNFQLFLYAKDIALTIDNYSYEEFVNNADVSTHSIRIIGIDQEDNEHTAEFQAATYGSPEQ